MMSSSFGKVKIDVEAQEFVTVLHFHEGSNTSVECVNQPEIGDLVAFPEGKAPNILLNFRNLASFSGQELTPLIKLVMGVRLKKGRIAACYLSTTVRELLEIARLDRVLAIYTDQEQAVKGMCAPPSILA